jgi:23S rRNA (uracil1939-C5)-methyltransferase
MNSCPPGPPDPPERAGNFTVDIERLSHDGRGLARIGGKVTFVDGALAGERVIVEPLRRHGRFDEARLTAILEASADRADPPCPHFGVCGGCALQHLAPDAQLRHKEQVLLESLRRFGGVEPGDWLPPAAGPIWGYRRKARLGVKCVDSKGGVIVGFRERRTNLLAQLGGCAVLHPSVGSRIPALRETLDRLSVRNRVPQVEVAVGDRATAFVVRHLSPLSDADLDVLREFAERHDVDLYLQPGGPETITAFAPRPARALSYALPAFDVQIRFEPADFIQVNVELNRLLVARVIEQLAPAACDHVLELFCGLGNFTLPLGRRAGRVTGIDADAALVRRAADNAARNRIGNVELLGADLAVAAGWARRRYDRVLLDPPRSGARQALERIDLDRVARLVYVSCNPATLARDAGVLRARGMRLARAGIVDMFPHTAHVEAIAVFEQ